MAITKLNRKAQSVLGNLPSIAILFIIIGVVLAVGVVVVSSVQEGMVFSSETGSTTNPAVTFTDGSATVGSSGRCVSVASISEG